MLTSKTASRCTPIVTTIWLNATVAILLGPAITGCATVSKFSDTGSGRITIPVTYQDSSGNTLSIESRPADARVWLGAIPGTIFGRSRDELKTELIASPPAFELNLSELRDIAAKQSATLTAAASASGWKIAPADTRLIRVATNLNYKELHRHLPITKFVDLQSDKLLMLVYFDRPCRLTGFIVERPGESDTVNVTVGKAGLHWLEATGGATEGNYIIRHVSGPITPIFVARLPPSSSHIPSEKMNEWRPIPDAREGRVRVDRGNWVR